MRRNLTARTRRQNTREAIFTLDRQLLATTIIVLMVGLILLSAATSVISYEKFGDTYAILKQQVLHGVLPGLIGLIVFSLVPVRFFERSSRLLYFLTVVLVGASLLPSLGVEINESKSWIRLAAITVQPSEFAKIAFIAWAAGWLSQHRASIGSFKIIMHYAAHTAVVFAILIAQPDFGTMILYLIIAGAMLIASGARIRHIGLLSGLGLVAIIPFIALAPYRIKRLVTFWRPEADIQGAGYQLFQSFIAIGSGHWFGVGLGQSRQKFSYLPEVASDSIFAIIAEDLGFIFSTVILTLFGYLIYRCLRIARSAPNLYTQLFVFGIAIMIASQLCINIASIIGLAPLTGIPMPLVSLGGSNMVTVLSGIGIILGISRESRA